MTMTTTLQDEGNSRSSSSSSRRRGKEASLASLDSSAWHRLAPLKLTRRRHFNEYQVNEYFTTNNADAKGKMEVHLQCRVVHCPGERCSWPAGQQGREGKLKAAAAAQFFYESVSGSGHSHTHTHPQHPLLVYENVLVVVLLHSLSCTQ